MSFDCKLCRDRVNDPTACYKPYCSNDCQRVSYNRAPENGHWAMDCPVRIEVTTIADGFGHPRYIHGCCKPVQPELDGVEDYLDKFSKVVEEGS